MVHVGDPGSVAIVVRDIEFDDGVQQHNGTVGPASIGTAEAEAELISRSEPPRRPGGRPLFDQRDLDGYEYWSTSRWDETTLFAKNQADTTIVAICFNIPLPLVLS